MMSPVTRQRWFSRLYPGMLPVLIYQPRKDERLSWPRWLAIPRYKRRSPIQVLTGADENVTTLIETNALTLSQATTDMLLPICYIMTGLICEANVTINHYWFSSNRKHSGKIMHKVVEVVGTCLINTKLGAASFKRHKHEFTCLWISSNSYLKPNY